MTPQMTKTSPPTLTTALKLDQKMNMETSLRTFYKRNFQKGILLVFRRNRASTIAKTIPLVVETSPPTPLIALTMAPLRMEIRTKRRGVYKRSFQKSISLVFRRRRTTTNALGQLSPRQKNLSRTLQRYQLNRCLGMCSREQMKSFMSGMETFSAALECLLCRKSYKLPSPRIQGHS